MTLLLGLQGSVGAKRYGKISLRFDNDEFRFSKFQKLNFVFRMQGCINQINIEFTIAPSTNMVKNLQTTEPVP